MISTTPNLNKLILADPVYGKWVYDSLHRFMAGDYGSSLLRFTGGTQSIYAYDYLRDIVITRSGENIEIGLNQDRIMEFEWPNMTITL